MSQERVDDWIERMPINDMAYALRRLLQECLEDEARCEVVNWIAATHSEEEVISRLGD